MITAAAVWEWMRSTSDRSTEPASAVVMDRVVDAVEELWLERWSVLVAKAVTITASDDLFTRTGHGHGDGDAIRLFALVDGDPLEVDVTYFVRDSTADTFKVAATAGGAAVDVTVDGTADVPPVGTNRPTYIDQALTMQAARLYDRRKSVNGVIAGSPDLGPFRVGRFDPDIELLIDDQSWGVR